MSASLSALIVAVVGVLGTLASGLLAQRSAMRTKLAELEHVERQRHEERMTQENRENREMRRKSYAELNQAMRQFHTTLSRHFLAVEAGREEGVSQTQERVQDRQALYDIYAETQMVASDAVLVPAGRLVHGLHRAHRLLGQHEGDTPGSTPEESLGEIRARLEQASEQLYEVRQVMRQDLGITELPVTRPDDHRANR